MAQEWSMARPPLDEREKIRRLEFGDRLRGFREKAGLSYGRFAALLDVPKMHTQRWENGQAQVPLLILPRLCEVLGVTAAELLDDDRGIITRAL